MTNEYRALRAWIIGYGMLGMAGTVKNPYAFVALGVAALINFIVAIYYERRMK
jgi:hypothetical protein